MSRNLVRSLNGIRIHRADCRWAVRGHVRQWHWADTVSDQDLANEVIGMGMRPCRDCEPLKV